MVLTEAARRKFAGLAVAEPEVKLAARVKKGIPYTEVRKLTTRTGLPMKHLAKVAGIPKSTLAAKKGARLSATQGEKIVRVERIYAIAFDVFEDEEVAKKWLQTENPYLDGQTPLDLLENEPGANAVEHLLGQIDQGVY
jgi:putative toxin-antitoxin system antitoxin component (TIGR02293 family)